MQDNDSEQLVATEMMSTRMYSKLQHTGCCILKKLSNTFLAVCSTCLLVFALLLHYFDSYIIIFVVLFALAGLLCRLQEYLLYHPNEPVNSRVFVELPSAVGLPFENHYIRTRDNYTLNLYLMKQPDHLLPNAPTIVFFHGNAGNIGHRLMIARAVYELVAANVVLVDYRGYGKSSGTPSEQGLSIDAEATLDFVLQRSDINVRRVFVHGSSLGGAVATYVASLPYYADRIAGLLLENTFTCLPDMGRSLFAVHLLKYLPQWFFSEQYPSMQRIQRVTVPTLFLSGLADTLVPPRMMDILYLKCGSRVKVMVRFESGTHNDTWLCDGYYESVARFLSQVTQGSATSVVWNA